MKSVLDASALLAYLQDEPGSEIVESVLSASALSAVNWAEVVQKAMAGGVEIAGLRDDLEALGLTILPFTAEEATVAGQLWIQTRTKGLSLGDRACLSLAHRLGIPTLTTDRAWAGLNLGIEIRVIR